MGHLIEGWRTILGIWVMEWSTEGGNGIPEYGGPTGLTSVHVAESDRSESLQVRCPSIRQQRSGKTGMSGNFSSSQDPNDARTVLVLSRDSLQYVCLYGV